MTRELERLRKSSGPILVGPWISEVGFEVLYWAPFLNWAIKAYGLDSRRLIVISRGGAHLWYQHLAAEYIDVFDLFTVEEYRTGNEERWSERGHQKQFEITGMEREILDRATEEARSRAGAGAAPVADVQASSVLLVREGQRPPAHAAHRLPPPDARRRLQAN